MDEPARRDAMTTEGTDVTLLLRKHAQSGLPVPTAEFTRRAWEAFSAAVDRHLAARPAGLSRAGTRRR